MSEETKVAAADTMKGDVILHFSDGESVLFHGEYLH